MLKYYGDEPGNVDKFNGWIMKFFPYINGKKSILASNSHDKSLSDM